MSAIKDAAEKALAEGINIREVQAGKFELPPFYSGAYKNFMRNAQARDPEFDHFWVKVSARNEMLKQAKGWEPVEDAKELERLGLSRLKHANGRARSIDVELFRRRKEVGALVRKEHARLVGEKSASMKAALEAMSDDTVGRTRGKVVPFISSAGEVGHDVLDKQPYVAAKPAAKDSGAAKEK